MSINFRQMLRDCFGENAYFSQTSVKHSTLYYKTQLIYLTLANEVFFDNLSYGKCQNSYVIYIDLILKN